MSETNEIPESAEAKRARLSRPIGAMDAAIVKSACPEIPDKFLLELMFGGRGKPCERPTDKP